MGVFILILSYRLAVAKHRIFLVGQKANCYSPDVSWIDRQDARHRFFYSLLVAFAVSLAVRELVRFWTLSIIAWDVFATSALIFTWLTITFTPANRLRQRAREQDLSRMLIFIFVVLAACSSLFAVGFLLHTNKAEQRPHLGTHLVISLYAVVVAWLLAHTVFALRYAHTFYGDDNDPATDTHAGGLQFPNEEKPNYMDFAYFSFVIGMTFQVSDVVITSRNMRRLVLLHGILSFGFNTVILALAINTASSLL
jgi:uncharacterized membrane protein